MGETTNEVTPVAGESSHATEIRSGIEQTRSNLGATIDALQDKLDPTRIAEQVKDQIREKATEAFDSAKTAVKEATIGKAGEIMSNVSDAVTDMTGRAGTAMSNTGSSVVHYIRDNPIPFAFVGIGLGLLAMKKRRTEPSSHQSDSRPDPSLANSVRKAASGVVDSAATSVRDAASSAADTTRQQFHHVSDRARQGARMASDRLKGTLQDNPMALGMAALAAGALVGLTLPSTRVEGEYMGEARDRLVGQAKSVAQDVVGKIQSVTKEAGQTVKSAAQKEGLVAG